jgi:hypothetical protein
MELQCGKRFLSDSSTEDIDTPKKKCFAMSSTDEAPAWARDLQQEIRSMSENICVRMDRMEQSIETINCTVAGLQEKVYTANEEILNCQKTCQLLKSENCSLKNELTRIDQNLNEQVDRSLRNHLTFSGIVRKEDEKTWSDTEDILAKWLAAHTSLSKDDYVRDIVRCHRGPVSASNSPPLIHCQFTWNTADGLFKELGRHTTDGVRV